MSLKREYKCAACGAVYAVKKPINSKCNNCRAMMEARKPDKHKGPQS